MTKPQLIARLTRIAHEATCIAERIAIPSSLVLQQANQIKQAANHTISLIEAGAPW